MGEEDAAREKGESSARERESVPGRIQKEKVVRNETRENVIPGDGEAGMSGRGSNTRAGGQRDGKAAREKMREADKDNFMKGRVGEVNHAAREKAKVYVDTKDTLKN